MENSVLVTIRCLVYNHEPFLRQCLDGFVMQKTNFRFEAIVHDDASTDGSADIIREYAEKYPDIIKPIIETENQYSKRDGSLRRIMNAHTHGKYIAICEGDDYWTDPLKLQKQVDFLESNSQYGMVYTNAYKFIQKENRINGEIRWQGGNAYEDILITNHIPTLTVLHRKEAIEGYEEFVKGKNFPMGDVPKWLYIATKYKIHHIDDFTAVYRVLENSASHFDDEKKYINFVVKSYALKCFFIEKVPSKVDAEIRRLYFYWSSILAALENKKIEALTLFFKSKGISFKKTLKFFKYLLKFN